MSQELFAQMMNEDYESNPLINQDHPEFCTGFIETLGKSQTESIAIKEDLPAVCERLDDIVEPKEEHLSDVLEMKNQENRFSDVEDVPAQHSDTDDDELLTEFKIDVEEHEVSRIKQRASDTQGLELQNQENSFSDVEDVPAQHSESDSEDDVPLMEFKTEVAAEQEVLMKNWRASDTQRAPRAKKPALHPLRTKLEDVFTEEQKEYEQSDMTVVQDPPNCTVTSVTKFKDPLPFTTARVTNSGLDMKSRIIYEDDTCTMSSKGIGIDDLNSHPRLCVQKKSFKCKICQRCFNKKSNLNNHIRTHTGEKPHKCHICQRGFGLKGTLMYHIRTHTGEKPFKCEVCQRCFAGTASLTRHSHLHTVVSPYKCEICYRCFTENDSLTRHIQRHSVKPYKCDICQCCFNKNTDLTNHIRTHTGEKPYRCDICQRSFGQKSTLIVHIRTHTGAKYKCQVCQQCFTDKTQLSSHNCTQKLFKCDVCDRFFAKESHLSCHNRAHTGEKPYKCDICQGSFKSKWHLTKHMLANKRRKNCKM